ncbi:hypothetical protein [Mameliella sediminis]|uniref:hypothetical protein n=1 Tax=Mameliella sediminis TaxID=2836866 RepID=UPI001C47BB10|nr:hypothetical protein [Mameliella sediminis]MBV7394118.1 hypothetical protein [Mameliella sediminis]
MLGWIAVDRSLLEHPVFKKKPDRICAWLWMISTAAWKPVKMDANGKTVTVKRGQLLTSYRQMKNATGVGIQVLRTLIVRLEKEGTINTDTTHGSLLITICNYDKYQAASARENTQVNTPSTQGQHTKEQDYNIPVGTSAAAPVDPTKMVFDSGVQILVAAGIPERKARSIIGNWRKEHRDEAVLAAIGRCQREGAVNPVAFIGGALRFQREQEDKRKSHPEINEIREINGVRKRYAGNGVGWVTEHV